MNTLPKVGVLGSILATVGLGVGSAFSGKLQKTRRRFTKEDYRQTCYKWIYYDSTTKGEVWVCIDKNKTQADSPSYFFNLWWLGEKENNRHFEVEKIKLEGKLISFTFKNSKHNTLEKKLQIHDKQFASVTKNMSNLNNQPLKDICTIKGNNLSCNSSSGNYSYYVRNHDTYWFLRQ